MFPSLLPQFGSAFFSSKEGGMSQYFCPYNECTVDNELVFGDKFLAQGLHL